MAPYDLSVPLYVPSISVLPAKPLSTLRQEFDNWKTFRGTNKSTTESITRSKAARSQSNTDSSREISSEIPTIHFTKEKIQLRQEKYNECMEKNAFTEDTQMA